VRPFVLTPAAESDLFLVWSYIAKDDQVAADQIEADILAACGKVAERLDLGHFRRDLTDKPVRFFPVRRTYLVVYDPSPKPIQILRILHGARDVLSELKE
jgi:plasmid stabilization system protein ParE